MWTLIKLFIVLIILINPFEVSAIQISLDETIETNRDTITYEMDTINFSGSLIVLDFFTSYCKPCFNSMPYFESLIDQYSNNTDIQFYYVNPFDNQKIIKKIIRKKRLTIPVIHDTNHTLYSKCEYKVLPRAIILDNRFNVVWEGRPSQIDSDLLGNLLNNKDYHPIQLKDSMIYLFNNGKMKLKIELSRTDSVTKYSWENGLFTKKVELINKSFKTCLETLFDEARLMPYQINFLIPPPPEPYFNISISCSKKQFKAAIDSVVRILCDFKMYESFWKEDSVDIYKLKVTDKKKLETFESKDSEGYTLYRVALYLEQQLEEINVEYKGFNISKYNIPIYVNEVESLCKVNELLKKFGLELEHKIIQVPVLTITSNY